jgi:hypothetical protein
MGGNDTAEDKNHNTMHEIQQQRNLTVTCTGEHALTPLHKKSSLQKGILDSFEFICQLLILRMKTCIKEQMKSDHATAPGV